MTEEIKDTLYEVECPLCGRLLDLRVARNDNPYFTCPDCGLRCFVNSPSGKERLARLVKLKEQGNEL